MFFVFLAALTVQGAELGPIQKVLLISGMRHQESITHAFFLIIPSSKLSFAQS